MSVEQTKLPEAPSSPEQAEAAPSQGKVSAEAVSEGQTRAIDQQLAALDERARQVRAESATDAELEETSSVESEAQTKDPEEEPSFGGKVMAYYEAMRANGSNWFGAGLSTIVFAVAKGGSDFWKWLKGLFEKDEDEEENEDPHYRTDDEIYEPDDPETKKLVETAKEQLKSALEKNPTWLDFAEEAGEKFKIPVHTLFAFARFESAFNPNAVNGTVEGLGQFWGPTWESFKTENPEFKNASRKDPRASFFAMAWYAQKNAKQCKIDPLAPDAAARLYEAHHEGANGFAQLQAFRRGERTDKQRIPKTYKGKSFPKFGVPVVDTYENYVKLVTAMSDKVQVVADLYKAELPTYATQPTS